MRRSYGPPRDLGPGDLGVRELADQETAEDEAEGDEDIDARLAWAEPIDDFLN